jgi:GT2 family glycosyltransferase
MPTKVYIIILNYLQWQDTRDCLESVLKSSYTDYSILIIDNNSGNNSLEHLIEWAANQSSDTLPLIEKQTVYPVSAIEMLNTTGNLADLPRLAFIQNKKNEGFAAGNNLALRFLASRDAYTWLLNPDMIIEQYTLAELVNFADRQTNYPVIGAEVRAYTGNQDLLFYGGGTINFLSGTVHMAKSNKAIERLDYISGGCLFTHASNFKKLGLLPEEYFLYWEETDWCFRAKQQGVRLLVCRSAVCYDKISTVIGKGFLADYYYSRNGLLFISKFRKKNIPVALFSMKMRWFKRIIAGQGNRARGVWKGTIDFLKKKFNAV